MSCSDYSSHHLKAFIPEQGVSFFAGSNHGTFLAAMFLQLDAFPDTNPFVAFDPAGIITSILVLISPTFRRMTG